MQTSFSQRFFLSFLVAVSLFGLFLAVFLSGFPLSIQEDFKWRKPLVGFVFGLTCFLGMIAVFFPSHCSAIFHATSMENRSHAVSKKKKAAFQKTSTVLGFRIIHGHHPDCESFRAHEFQIGKKTFCTACMGLLSGAFASIFGVAAYFFLGWNIEESGFLFLLLGVSGVGLGLLQYVFFDIQWRLVRLLLNALFVFGAFLVLVGIDVIVGSLLLDFFIILLSIFWLYTRILLSKHIHNKICTTCNFKSSCRR